jgi:hypothetical protein
MSMNAGSFVMLPTPLLGSGVVQQKLNALLV